MKMKVSSLVGLLAWLSLLALPWYVLISDTSLGNRDVYFAAGVWVLVGIVASSISTGGKEK